MNDFGQGDRPFGLEVEGFEKAAAGNPKGLAGWSNAVCREERSKTQERGENKNPERDRAEGQSERRAAHGVMLGRNLDQRWRQTERGCRSVQTTARA